MGPGDGRDGHILRRLVVLLASLVFLLACLEVGARIWARATERDRGATFDPDLGYHLLPHVAKRGAQWGDDEPARTNSRGWRDAEESLERIHGQRRIVALGDSFTFGIGVDYGERWTEYLEELVPRLEVVNLGVNGFGTDQELRVLETAGLAYRPDVVVLAVYVGNDIDDIRYERNGHWPKPYYLLEEGELVLVPPPETWDVRLRLSTYLGEALFRVIQPRLPYRVRAPAWETADTTPLFRAIVARMAERCAEAGARLLVLVAHHPDRAAEGPWPEEARAIAALHELGLPVVDTLDPITRAKPGLHLPNLHWNPVGHRIAAELVAERLEALGWLDD